MIDTYAMTYFQNLHSKKFVDDNNVDVEMEIVVEHEVHTHGYVHNHASLAKSSELLRHRIISKVKI
jgi:hypothetical protein